MERRDKDNLRKLARDMGFGIMEDYLLQHSRPSIRVYTKPVEDESLIPIGQSKIGGRPDLPPHLDWVQVEYWERTGSLSFVAQINLEEVKPYDNENLLPDQGILYFFANPFGPKSAKTIGRVLFFDGDRSILERKPFPDDVPLELMESGERYTPCTLEYVPEVNLPFIDANWKEPEIYPAGKTWQDFHELMYSVSYMLPPHSRTVNRLLGYNFDIPEDMQLNCELIDTFGSEYNAPGDLRDKCEKTKGEWQLLFQMDSDGNAGMMWSDSGMICFYIRREDLAQQNFDNTCLAFFSS